MKRAGVDGNFILCFLLNLVLNGFWALPAVVLFVAHFVAGIPIWPAWAALILWIVIVFGVTAFMSWAASTSTTSPSRQARVTTHYSSESNYRPSGQTSSPTPAPESAYQTGNQVVSQAVSQVAGQQVAKQALLCRCPTNRLQLLTSRRSRRNSKGL